MADKFAVKGGVRVTNPNFPMANVSRKESEKELEVVTASKKDLSE